MSCMNLLCLFLKKLNKRSCFNSNYFISAVFLFGFISCSFFSESIKTSCESGENVKNLIRDRGLLINSVIVNKSFDSETVRENALYVFYILLGPPPQVEEGGLKADAVLKEESFMKGFDQLNTVSLEITVRNTTGEILKKVLITEDSENTLSSYKYLYKTIEKGIKETGLPTGKL